MGFLSCFRKKLPDAEDALKEDTRWYVGRRYEVAGAISLHSDRDLSNETSTVLKPRSVVRILALRHLQETPMRDGVSEADSRVSVVRSNSKATRAPLAYVATDDGEFGWALVDESPPSAPALSFKCREGSWVEGGRYRLLHSLVLRSGIDMESEKKGELNQTEEVVIFDFALLLVGVELEPRLRAHVRAQDGQLGWLTLESWDHIAGTRFVETRNLYWEGEGVKGVSYQPACAAHRSSSLGRKRRRTLSGEEETWEIGGRYRVLVQTPSYAGPNFTSPVVGVVKKGVIVAVTELSETGGMEASLWLNVSLDLNNPTVGIGWIRPIGANNVLYVDVRDHMEYYKLMRLMAEKELASGDAEVFRFTVTIDRSKAESLGLEVEAPCDELPNTLIVIAVSEGPFEDWNVAAQPDRRVCHGDRVVSVNGVSGHVEALLAELRKEHLLHIVIEAIRRKQTPPISTEIRSLPSHEQDTTLPLEDAARTLLAPADSPSASSIPEKSSVPERSVLTDSGFDWPASPPAQCKSEVAEKRAGVVGHSSCAVREGDVTSSSAPTFASHAVDQAERSSASRSSLSSGDDIPELRTFHDGGNGDADDADKFECCSRLRRGQERTLGMEGPRSAGTAGFVDGFFEQILEAVAGNLGCHNSYQRTSKTYD